MITGYNDDFNRTVANGIGTATSGQAYSIFSTASNYNVSPSTATILPPSISDRLAWVDRQTADIDISGQVALSQIPATVLATVGFVVKLSSISNYYVVSMMVATGGAISLRFSKVVGGGLTTISTIATTLTYVAGTFYNLRAQAFWSNPLQTNVFQSKIWLVGGTEPGGWMAVATDNTLTYYGPLTGAGIHTRNEATIGSTNTASFRNVVARTYGLPVPAAADTMCADPAITYPDQTALESLADAADAVMVNFDALASLATLFPRVRVSRSNWTYNTATTSNLTPTYDTTEFNIGTPTNLGYDSRNLSLPSGIWLVTFEVQMATAPIDHMDVRLSSSLPATAAEFVDMRTNASQSNLDGQGGSCHVSTLVTSTDPVLPASVTAQFGPTNLAVTYTFKYVALSAIKISDYFV